MAISLSEADHQKLDSMLDAMLDACVRGKVSSLDVRAALAHVITAVATGNEGELRAWLEPKTIAQWEELIANS